MLGEQFLKDFEEFEEELQAQPQQSLEEDSDNDPLKAEIRNCRNHPTIQQAAAYLGRFSRDEFTDIHSTNTCVNAIEIVDSKIDYLFKVLLKVYHSLFPELEMIIHNPVTFSRTILYLLGNDFDGLTEYLREVDKQLEIAVILAHSHRKNTGENADSEIVRKSQLLSEAILDLQDLKKSFLEFVTKQTEKIAPNVFHLIGGQLTAVLLSKTGGIKELSMIPACNIQVIGEERSNLLGLSKHGKKLHLGCFRDHPLVQSTRDEFQVKLAKMLANGVAKVSRIDAMGLSPDGEIGKNMHLDILTRFEKYQLPKSGQMRQPLRAPEEAPKRRRGGKKYRRMKERLGMTEAAKLKNRLKFGTDFSEEVMNGTEGLGMLTQQKIGVLKVNKKIDKIQLTAKQKARLAGKAHQGDLGDLTSKLAFSQREGIELINPAWKPKQVTAAPNKTESFGFKVVAESRKLQNN